MTEKTADTAVAVPTPQLFDMSNKVAVVTGGGRGIGAGIATSFAQAGAAVAIAARRTDEIEAVAESIRNAGGQAIAVTTDVTDDEAVDALARRTVDAFGSITTWVNNAGGSSIRMPLVDLPRGDWDHTVALNLTAVFVGCTTAARYIESGAIINISSPAGNRPIPLSAHYGAAKAGTNSLTWSLAAELAPNIRVNAIAPGAVPTEVMMASLGETDETVGDLVKQWRIPLRRLGTPQDIGAACVYFASDAASWVTGEILNVAGGSI